MTKNKKIQSVDDDDRRFVAAVAAMQSLVSHYGMPSDLKKITVYAVELADALMRELQAKGKTMGLSVHLSIVRPCEVFEASISHNFISMADEAGIGDVIWHPELFATKAGELVAPLTAGVALMRSDPARFKAFDASNRWGTYDQFVPWVERYLTACKEYPDAEVRVRR